MQSSIREGKGSHIEFAGYPEDFKYREKADNFYYHVTLKRNVKRIVRDGLQIGAGGTMADGGWYQQYSRGKLFFCDRPGVQYWADTIENHLEYNIEGQTPKLVVIRFPKNFVPDAKKDEAGTRDSGAGAYYVTHAIKNLDDTEDMHEGKNMKTYEEFIKMWEDGVAAPVNNAGSGTVAGFTVATGLPGPQPIGGASLVRRKKPYEDEPIQGIDTLRGQ